MLKQSYTETAGVTIGKAYDELTRAEFAVWIRMMTEPNGNLIRGKKWLSSRYKYKNCSFHEVTDALRRKGYINVISYGRGIPVEIVLLKRAIITSPNNFIKLGSIRNGEN